MDGLSVAASVAGIISLGIQVTQSLVDYYEAYKDQKSDIANTAKKLENLLCVLESLCRQLTNRKFRADEQDLLETIEGSIEVCEENIHELQTKVEKFKDSSGDGIRAAVRTATRQLAYPFKESTLRKLDADIDEIVSHLSLALQVLQQKDIGNVQDDIEDAKAVLDLVRASQISSTIRDWLKAPDATINYNEAYKMKHPGTGLWFVKGSYFSAWLAKPKSFLWLNGFAGCGKSVLCSTAIQYALRHRGSNPRIGIAFFFFTFNDDSKQDASAMLRALVLQLSSQLNDNHVLLSRLYDRYCNATPPDQDLEDCMHQLVRAFEHVYIILDALDESPRDKHRWGVLKALVIIREWLEPGLHLLVTSRDETDIRDVLRDELYASLDEIVSMKNDSVHSDIASFVSCYLKESRGLQRWEKYHDQIEKALTERANGVCVLRFLSREFY
jgi:ankyrin repeat domain-containing protein 50